MFETIDEISNFSELWLIPCFFSLSDGLEELRVLKFAKNIIVYIEYAMEVRSHCFKTDKKNQIIG